MKTQPSGTIENSSNIKLFLKDLRRIPRSQLNSSGNNAMDTAPGHIRARAALSEDKMAQLCREGKCFKCKRQGHIGRNCPNSNSQICATDTNNASKSANTQNATNTSTASSGTSNIPTPLHSIKKINAQELVKLVQDMDQGEKDKVIQDIFMNEDFA
jgi:hypothetical protein